MLKNKCAVLLFGLFLYGCGGESGSPDNNTINYGEKMPISDPYNCTTKSKPENEVYLGLEYTKLYICKQDYDQKVYYYKNDELIKTESKITTKDVVVEELAIGTKDYVYKTTTEYSEITSTDLYGCGDWLPENKDFKVDESFEQSRICYYDQIRTAYYYDHWKSGIVELTETELRTMSTDNSKEQTQQAMGVTPYNTFKNIFLGNKSSYAVDSENDLWVSGLNTNNQIGFHYEDYTDKKEYHSWEKTSFNDEILKISTGYEYYALLLNKVGEVWTIGKNSNVQQGSMPYGNKEWWTKSDIPKIKDIAAGWAHSYAVDENGDIWGTGYNSSNQLSGITYGVPCFGSAFCKVKEWKLLTNSVSNVEKIFASRNSGYAIDSEGSLWVVGGNGSGELGISSSGHSYCNDCVISWTKTPLQNVTSMANGIWHSYALDSNGNVWFSGFNNSGQFGEGVVGNVFFWSKTSLRNIKKIYATRQGGIAIDENENIFVSGANQNSQLMVDLESSNTCESQESESYPCLKTWTQVNDFNIDRLFVGKNNIYKMDKSGLFYGRGLNSSGELGIGSEDNIFDWYAQPKDFID